MIEEIVIALMLGIMWLFLLFLIYFSFFKIEPAKLLALWT